MTTVAGRRRIKKHLTYTYGEAANILSVHVRTVHSWGKRGGLHVYAAQKPHLIDGADLIAFLDAQKAKRKRPTTSTQLYCFRCRQPRRPALDMVECVLPIGGSAQLTAICPDCETTMHKRISRSSIPALQQKLDVTIRQAESGL